MSCKQSELIAAINSFSAAVVSNDPNLKAFSSQLLGTIINKIEFDPEEEAEVEEPVEDSVEAEVSAES